MSDLFESAGPPADAPRPLADRLRPASLADVVGQDHILGVDAPLGRMLAAGRLSWIIFWGPPGGGKTTIARLLAEETDRHFEQISAIFSGVAELRKVFDAAKARRNSPSDTTSAPAPIFARVRITATLGLDFTANAMSGAPSPAPASASAITS